MEPGQRLEVVFAILKKYPLVFMCMHLKDQEKLINSEEVSKC
jgi:hypothetical protein